MMGQFADLAKIKHRAVEDLRKQLQLIQVELHRKERERDHLKEEFATLALPHNGTIAEAVIFGEASRVYRREIESVEREIFAIHQRAFQTRFHLKKALIEYEKMSHLEKEERAIVAIAAKSSEAKALDEIAVISRNFAMRAAR
ncbi:hypothetical protein AGMMS50229_15100 [Campylobacterota bacterium]|nr:hypothetical protein AGMMS50229_15100 [Campylobacterota bacterium]